MREGRKFKEYLNQCMVIINALTHVFFRLGTSAEGATLRARMQSACLLSDMESFKVSQCLVNKRQ